MTRPLILLLLSFCLVSTISGQNRWSAGVDGQFGFTGTDKMVTTENSTTITARSLETQENFLSSSAGMGIWVAYKVGKRFGLRSSVGYLNGGNQERMVNFSESRSTGQRTLLFQESISFRQGQLQIPVEIVYESAKGKLRPYLTFGVQTNYHRPITFFREAVAGDGSIVVESWSRENSRYTDDVSTRFQAVASIGLRVNAHMVIRLRHTFAKSQDITIKTNCTSIASHRYVGLRPTLIDVVPSGLVHATTSCE